uniref:Uncharacterized protein n=1 Tax=Chromera velia CCMP2878 TaxID=1169474 RepID=A0A0G4I360_9ALVE|eukprot:Cvel_10528.t1-p1 / transcript=Cvel_10528.t1 / gene=Cvel_10528 / organism=Chromera_velia_CCMP2878 / gene_product=hypothetical protein / transcript_product=hypothetical protein / location=Cvel_scaffold637:18172-18507(-) / protein_length=112 / sequence_SO=supercontig / SO=protein_coding / is_pseudo=false
MPVLIIVLTSICDVSAVVALSLAIWWIVRTRRSAPVESQNGAASAGPPTSSASVYPSVTSTEQQPQVNGVVCEVICKETKNELPQHDTWSLPYMRKLSLIFKREASLLNDVE